VRREIGRQLTGPAREPRGSHSVARGVANRFSDVHRRDQAISIIWMEFIDFTRGVKIRMGFFSDVSLASLLAQSGRQSDETLVHDWQESRSRRQGTPNGCRDRTLWVLPGPARRVDGVIHRGPLPLDAYSGHASVRPLCPDPSAPVGVAGTSCLSGIEQPRALAL
jgi:hypothetical protein